MNSDRILAAIESYTTPIAVVDEELLRANILAMQAHAENIGAALRPHAKTHKSVFVGRLQLQAGARGLTVATLREAEYFAQNGVDDLLLVHPPIGAPKRARLAALAERVPHLSVALDSLEAARELPPSVGLLWEVDSGHHRLGTAPGRPTVEAIKPVVELVGSERFHGLLTFPGHVYQATTSEARKAIASQELSLLQDTAALLQAEGITVRELSIGSTPTAAFAQKAERMAEIRAGTYVYGDANQVTLGSQSLDACALGVVATVVSTPAQDRAVIDAGTKSLSVDAPVPGLKGFGSVLGAPHLVLERMSEEHGMLSALNETGLRIGDRVVIIPVHCCTTVNLHDHLMMVAANGTGAWDEVGARGWQKEGFSYGAPL